MREAEHQHQGHRHRGEHADEDADLDHPLEVLATAGLGGHLDAADRSLVQDLGHARLELTCSCGVGWAGCRCPGRSRSPARW